MATMLEKYMISFSEISKMSPLPIERMWEFQELIYRIEVLQVCQMFSKMAPLGNKANQSSLITHYHMVDGYFECLKNERRIGPTADENLLKQRDTAHQNLGLIITDYRKRFQSYNVKTPEQYGNDIGKVISTFLPAWVQFRNTYINISSKET